MADIEIKRVELVPENLVSPNVRIDLPVDGDPNFHIDLKLASTPWNKYRKTLTGKRLVISVVEPRKFDDSVPLVPHVIKNDGTVWYK